ncbi:hypothetical protein CR513_17491, partial [Mucuna pruriens]
MAKVLGEANFGKIYSRPSSGTRYSVMNYASPSNPIVSVAPQGDADWRVNANPREAPPNLYNGSASVFASWRVNTLNQSWKGLMIGDFPLFLRLEEVLYIFQQSACQSLCSLDSVENYHLGMPVWQTTPNNDLFVIPSSDVLLTA